MKPETPARQKIGMALIFAGLAVSILGQVLNQENTVAAGYRMLAMGVTGLALLITGMVMTMKGRRG